jgi:hypothetical protein
MQRIETIEPTSNKDIEAPVNYEQFRGACVVTWSNAEDSNHLLSKQVVF